ncbi:MAG: hypothetical protein IPK52_21230, partial [Chloroflexi bacterium]|nr:hypothetical protein [Chloroflexota bacterium]
NCLTHCVSRRHKQERRRVVKAFESVTGHDIIVDQLGHLMGAIGVAILARKQQQHRFDFDIKDIEFRTWVWTVIGCPNDRELVCVLRDPSFWMRDGESLSGGYRQC